MNVLGDSARRIVGAGYGAGYGLVMDNLVTPEGGDRNHQCNIDGDPPCYYIITYYLIASSYLVRLRQSGYAFPVLVSLRSVV